MNVDLSLYGFIPVDDPLNVRASNNINKILTPDVDFSACRSCCDLWMSDTRTDIGVFI